MKKQPPKFKAGDQVVVDDPDYPSITRVVLGLSPSTRTRRAYGQWRYRLCDGVYVDENVLRPADKKEEKG